ncbi:hypothetical protein [Hydrogenophaga sp.]|jgi:hypothetical protein|uniref:hypothetical protein n=1 Tax=Hydrogenophaga sp. TaxID=1904254 RepID=UPI003F703CC5
MSHIHRYAKTPQAWEALARPDLVGRRAHTLLLMANGRRSTQELSLLLGEDVTDMASQLQQRGLLQDMPSHLPTPEVDDEEVGSGKLRASV